MGLKPICTSIGNYRVISDLVAQVRLKCLQNVQQFATLLVPCFRLVCKEMQSIHTTLRDTGVFMRRALDMLVLQDDPHEG